MNFGRVRWVCGAALSAFVLALFQGADGHPARAQDGGSWVETPQAAARLISAVGGVGSLERLPLGLEFRLQPGWKTYWRSPGDAGLPAQVDIAGSRNAGKAELRWPVPHRFELFGLQTFGYGEHVVLPLDVDVSRPGEPVAIRAKLRYLVCEVICIPLEATLALDLPAGPATPSAHAALINRYSSLVPAGPERLGWRVSAPVLAKDGTIVIDMASDWIRLQAPDVVIEGSPTHVFNRPRVELTGGGTGARLTVSAERVADGPALEAQELTFTLFDGERGAEIAARLAAPSAVPDLGPSASGLLAILGVALLGGLILNIMPCVLPVLILKLTSVIAMSSHEDRRLRLSFVATAAGILASFLVLAGALSLVKLSGASIGWGIQFQQPLFLGAMVAVCLAFAANLFGFFEIPMPAFVGLASVAADRSASGEYAKAFLSGVLATALATPCSAPFVGTAVGFALGRGTGEILMVFAALGLGLALPYLTVAVVPAAVGLLPRPGPWMVWLRRVLALSLVGTAIWLLGVIGGQLGWTGSWVAAGNRGPWVEFEEPMIARNVAAGRLVFVDVTADWCLTCQANKTLVLDREPVASRLGARDLVAMRADWTKPDPRISAFLERFGRYGIPFYVVFGPRAPDGIALPELLTGDIVMQAIANAGESP